MAIQTTLNIHKDIMEKITQASKNTGMSGREIIIKLLMKVMSNDCKKATITGSVKYQESDKKEMWRPFHIQYKGNEYEYFLDLRRLLKMSLSYIVAYAVKKYMNIILYGEDTDNYIFQNYILAQEFANGVIFWKLFWGFPKNVEEFIEFTPS